MGIPPVGRSVFGMGCTVRTESFPALILLLIRMIHIPKKVKKKIIIKLDQTPN